ncbi:hypothetical protein BGZ68_001726 [Mortierella alpina]|nr:hypothetical protein BGZ68_001726 [Mortierella alpina]
MSRTDEINLQIKCLVFDPSNKSKAYALVDIRKVHILVEALIPATDPQAFTWKFVSAGWSFQESYTLEGTAASCIMNNAGELIAMGSWSGSGNQTSYLPSRHGLVYNPYNPLPLIEGRQTSNALWMEVNAAGNINQNEREKAQLMIDLGTYDNSAMEIALTGSRLSIRRLQASGGTLRELTEQGGWMLPRPLDDASTAQIQYSNNSLYLFSTYGANDASLVRIPFNPNSTIPSQVPIGTTPIDISSTTNKCSWNSGYSTAVSGHMFYLYCQRTEVGGGPIRNLFVYDNTANNQNPKLGAAVPVTGIDPSCKINMFQPLGARAFAMLGCERMNDVVSQSLLSLSGSSVGTTLQLSNSRIWLGHDTLFNNILPNQEEIWPQRESGIPSEEGTVGLVFGILAVLAAVVFLTVRYRRRQRQPSNKNLQNDAESSPDSFGLAPLGASGLSSSVGLTAGAAPSGEANTHLSPSVYAAPQSSIPPSPALSAGTAAPLSSTTLSPAPSEGSPSLTTSGPPPANTFQMELQQLGFSSHPRPNIVTTVND